MTSVNTITELPRTSAVGGRIACCIREGARVAATLLVSGCCLGASSQQSPMSRVVTSSPLILRHQVSTVGMPGSATGKAGKLTGNQSGLATRPKVLVGSTPAAAMTRPAFDPSVLKGTYAAAARVVRHDGKPASGGRYRLIADVPRIARVVVAEGTLPQSGIVLLRDLAGGTPAAPYFRLEVDGLICGGLQFRDGPTTRSVMFRMPPNTGDVAPDLRLIDVFSSGTVKLSDFLGQVVYVDFWATWCGPCQVPMQHLQEIAQARAADWKDRAVVLAISLDNDTSTVLRRLAERGWTAARQLWSPGGTHSWDAEAARIYGIHSIPDGMLIDTNGTIAWRGNPNVNFDLEREVDRLLR